MEHLVIVVDRANPGDIYKDAKLYKRGMVIAIFPDGWSWGYQELHNPDFRIIRTPDLDDATVSALLAPEDGFGTDDPDTSTLQIRKNKLNLDSASAPQGFQTFIQDSQRASPIFTVSPLSQLTNLIVAIPPVQNPTVV